MPALRFPPSPHPGYGLVPVYRPIRAVVPYGSYGEGEVKIPSGAAKALGLTSRKVSVAALAGIRKALSILKSAAVQAGKDGKARDIQGWIDQIYAMEQSAATTAASGGRAQDGTHVEPHSSPGGTTGGGARPGDVPAEVADEGSKAGLWVAAAAVIAVVSGAAYWYTKPRSNGRRRNGRRGRAKRFSITASGKVFHKRRHNSSCRACGR